MKNKIVIEKVEFIELIEALNSINVVKFFEKNDEIGISFNTNKIIALISDIGIEINILKTEFEKINSKEAQILLLVLNKSRMGGVSSIELDINYIICAMFLIKNFYNFYSPIIKENMIIVSIDKEIKIILDSLDEIRCATEENYTLSYIICERGDKIELELTEPFKAVLNDIRLKNKFK